MFEEFREQANQSSFDDKQPEIVYEEVKPPRRSSQRILGMTAPQRFVIALLLLMMTCILGTFCLLVTGKVLPPLF
jgi:hypothetical protein